jgi:putative endonuclease
MHYTYVLLSARDGKFYVGYTANVRERLAAHNKGRMTSTKHRSPFRLIYYEACRGQKDALRRERYLKSTYGRRYLKNRLRGDLDA